MHFVSPIRAENVQANGVPQGAASQPFLNHTGQNRSTRFSDSSLSTVLRRSIPYGRHGQNGQQGVIQKQLLSERPCSF
jgi:hypothetical protein